MPPWLAAAAPQLISAGASMISGMFGGGDTMTPHQQRESVNTQTKHHYAAVRDGAIKGGFNPLTALRATGGVQAVSTAPQPVLSSASFVGDAIGSAVSNWFNREQLAQDAEMSRIQVETAQEELNYLRARNTAPNSQTNFGYSIPQVTSYAVAQPATVQPVLSGFQPTPADINAETTDVLTKEAGNKNAYAASRTLTKRPIPTADWFEQMFGDVAGSVVGPALMGIHAGAYLGTKMADWQSNTLGAGPTYRINGQRYQMRKPSPPKPSSDAQRKAFMLNAYPTVYD